MRHNRFIAVNFLVLERKNRKIANFLKRIKRQNRFIDSFLEEQRIGVALTDSFFLNRAHHWSEGGGDGTKCLCGAESW
jgi:hypothetical protein